MGTGQAVTEIMITEMEPDHYGVQIEEGDVRTSHRVALSSELLDDLAMTELDPTRVVEETLEFLLEREPATNIPKELVVSELPQRYPGFVDELRSRVAPT